MKRITLAVAAAAIIGAVGIGGIGGDAPSASAIACTAPRKTSTAFARWGDKNLYFPAATFEAGTESWSLRNLARVGFGQNDFRPNGPTDRMALHLSGGSTASSPAWCVRTNEPTMRFFYRSMLPGAKLDVEVRVSNSRGEAVTRTTVTASGFGWNASPIIDLPDLHDANGQQEIRVTFTSRDFLASWQVDDVMIDPWVAR